MTDLYQHLKSEKGMRIR